MIAPAEVIRPSSRDVRWLRAPPVVIASCATRPVTIVELWNVSFAACAIGGRYTGNERN